MNAVYHKVNERIHSSTIQLAHVTLLPKNWSVSYICEGVYFYQI